MMIALFLKCCDFLLILQKGPAPSTRQCHALLFASLLARIAIATAKLFSHPSPKRKSNSNILQRAKHCQQWDVPLIHTRVQDDCSVSDVFRLPCLLTTRTGTSCNECLAHLFASVVLLSASAPNSFYKSSSKVVVTFPNTATVVFITLRDWIQRHRHCEPYRAIPMKANVRLVPSVFEMASKQDSSDSIFVLRCRPVFHPVVCLACLTFSAASALQLNSNLWRIRQDRLFSQRHQNCGSEGVTGFVTCERKVSFARLSEPCQKQRNKTSNMVNSAKQHAKHPKTISQVSTTQNKHKQLRTTTKQKKAKQHSTT